MVRCMVCLLYTSTINDKIVKIKDAGSIFADGFLSEAEIINGEGLLLTPGFIDSHVPVSYTHLDVYKRQGRGYIV